MTMYSHEDLPTEILETIFSHLSSKDLWSCLGVSTRWRCVANSDRFWKKHCQYVGIHESAISKLSDEIPLSSWATAYYWYYNQPVVNWGKGRWRELVIDLKHDKFVSSWHGQLGYIYYGLLGCVCIYKVTIDGEMRLLEQINVEILNQQTSIIHPFCFVTNVEFMGVCNGNISLIFKRIEERYRLTHCLSLSSESGLVSSTTDIENLNIYVLSNFNYKYNLRIRLFHGTTVWLYNEVTKSFHVFDLKMNALKLTLDYMNLIVRPKIPLLVSLHAKEIIVFNNDCDKVLTINESCVSSVCFNRDTLVVNKLSFKAGTTVRNLYSWDMNTGKELMNLLDIKALDVSIHEFQSYLLVLENERSIYKIACYCGRTGSAFWELAFQSEHGWDPELRIVMHEFVIVWPSYNDNDKYSLYNIENGKLVHEKNNGYKSDRVHHTNLLWVHESPGRLRVKSFL